MITSLSTAFASEIVGEKFNEIEAHVVGAGKDRLDVLAYRRVLTYSDGTETEDIVLPLREVCEHYGMNVLWCQEKQSVTVTREDFEKPYVFYPGRAGEGSYIINGKTYAHYHVLPCNDGYMSDNNCYFKTEENLPAYIYA